VLTCVMAVKQLFFALFFCIVLCTCVRNSLSAALNMHTVIYCKHSFVKNFSSYYHTLVPVLCCQQVQKCTLTVWSQPWLKSMKLTEFHCEAMTDSVNHVHRVSELSMGGHRPVDVSGYQVKHAVDFVIKHLNSQSDDFYSLELFQVVNGTQQVRLFTYLCLWGGSIKRPALMRIVVWPRAHPQCNQSC